MEKLLIFVIFMVYPTLFWTQEVVKITNRESVNFDQSAPLLNLGIVKNLHTHTEAKHNRGNRVHQDHHQNNPYTSASIEQRKFGKKPAPRLVASFDGLGFGFEGPQGRSFTRNPSDNSLAVGRDHIVQTVNSRMAIFSKKGDLYSETGKILYGAVETKNVFRGFGGPCEKYNNGDAVVRYDQLADRWLIVMPIFRRLPLRENEPPAPPAGNFATESIPGIPNQPGSAATLYQPPSPTEAERAAAQEAFQTRKRREPNQNKGSYCMCYAISTSSDPMGSYYRYEFVRPLFPDYPRPAVWPDGYYVPTSTGDRVIEKHACVVDRKKMLKGEDACEQCFILKDVNFLNNADLDGFKLPPEGSPNILMATGGSQLNGVFEDDGIYSWKMYINWEDHTQSKLEGPIKIPVAPYHYLGDGQLTNCVPQPGTNQHLDSQGDKIMARLVYRKIGSQESIVAVHSVRTTGYSGGIRWYEFRLDKQRNLNLFQQGTYAPEGNFRWMGSPAIDKYGNIGIGYSFGGYSHFAGQRFAGREAGDKLGKLTLKEQILVVGEAPQTTTLRWQDYTQTAVDPVDDCTIWYVGDYLKKEAPRYSTRIGAFKLPGCK